MATPRRLPPMLCLVATLAVAGCELGSDESPEAAATTVTLSPPTTGATTTTTGGTTTTAGPTSSTLPPGATPLELTARHPAGITLKLTSISIAEDSISIGVVVTNGGERDVNLNEFDDLVLVDDRGGKYLVAPPPQDVDVTVRKATTLRGTLVFTGQLDPQATTLTFITNQKIGGDNEFTRRPKITVGGIPVPRS